MLLYILGFIFSIMGIVGYFLEVSTLVVIAFVYIIIEALIGLYTGELRSVGTYVFATFVGLLVAVFTESGIFLAIAVALCFEELVMGVMSIIFLLITAMVNNRQN